MRLNFLSIKLKSMKKVFNSNLRSPKGAKGREIAQFPGTQAFFPLKKVSEQYELLAQTAMKRKIQCYRVKLENSKSNSFMMTYIWRLNTSLPIVKSFYLNTVCKEEDNVSIQVFNEHCSHRLSDLNNLSVSSTFYLLKQSLIGFERLWQKFGPFIPSEKMVGINQSYRCKVWMNQNFATNTISKVCLSEKEFLEKLFGIFQEKAIKNQTTKVFFRQASFCQKIIKALKLIDAFVQVEKIKLPTKLDLRLLEGNKSMCIREGQEMKSSNITTFFKSAHSQQYISRLSPLKKIKNNQDTINSALGPTTRTHSPINDKSSNGTTLSQTFIKQKNYSLAKSSLGHNLKKEQSHYDKLNSPKTPMQKPYTKRSKGSMFMSGSIEADFIEDGKKKSIIQKFPQLTKGSLVESKFMCPQQLSVAYDNSGTKQREQSLKIEKPSNPDSQKKDSNKKIPINKRSTMQEDEQCDDVGMDVQPILMKNGWQRKIGNLFGGDLKEIMQSRCQGKQVRACVGYTRLLKLQALGAGVSESILPDQIDL